MTSDRAPRLYRFGPCTYTPGLRELRDAGVRVVVPLQESKVLTALLEHPGELVSKAQLSERLWPGERYGDFDRAIHNLISKVRRLHPDAPRWIVTVPKAGYKLAIAVEIEWAARPDTAPSAVLIEPASARTPPAPESASTPAADFASRPALSVPAAEPASNPAVLASMAAVSKPAAEPASNPAVLASMAAGSEPAAEAAAIPAAAVAPVPAFVAQSRRAAIAIAAIAAAGLGVLAWLALGGRASATGPPGGPTTIGVLPFAGSGGDIGESDTLREQIADALARIPGAEVRAAHSLTPRMSETPEQLQRAARQLRLDLVIAGTYDARGDDYVLNLELIRGSDGTHLSSLPYRGKRAGLGALPERVAGDMPGFLRHAPDAEPQHLLGSTPSQAAYDLAFRARAALAQRGRSEVAQAVALYQRAITVDPRFARAWSGLAESQLVMANLGSTPTTGQELDRARDAAIQALTLDPSNAQAHSTLGLILLQHDCQLAQAEQHLRRAITSNPGFAAHHVRLAVLLTDEGRFAEALQEIARAHDCDPDWPVIDGTAMYVHIMARAYERAIADADALVRARPDWDRAHQHRGWALWYAGRHGAAIQAWRRAAELAKDAAAVAREDRGAQLLDQQGVRAYAELRIAAHAQQPDDDDFVLAEWYAFAGDRGRTLDALESLVTARDPESLKIPWNPAYDFVRDEPRFQRLVEQLRARCAN